MKTAIYIRVSTEEQVREGYSISAQLQRLKAFCISQEWEVQGVYADEGISAKDMNRPQLQKMLKGIEQGEVECVLVYRLDRLTRSVFDLYKMLETFDKYDCKFKSATEVYDTTTAMGRMFITIVAALAQWERENMGERYSMAITEKARQGKWPTNSAPIGYDINKETFILEVNYEEAEIVKTIFDKYQTLGMHSVAKILNDNKNYTKEGNKWSDNTIMKVLRNPVYIGKMRLNNEIYEGKHKAIIDEDLWETSQVLIKERASKPPRSISSNYIFSGKLKCPSCKRTMTGSYVDSAYKDKTTRYFQYRCRKVSEGLCDGAKNVSEKHLEKAFVEYLKTLDFTNIIEEVVNTGEKDLNKKDPVIDKKEIEKQLDKVKKRKKKWQYAWTEDLISDIDFKERMKEATEEEEKLQEQINEIKQDEPETINKEEIMSIISDIEKNWHTLDRKDKKSLVNPTIERIHYHHPRPDRAWVIIDKIDFIVS